jgi:diguanylate cyclase (GGDEF)-like protein
MTVPTRHDLASRLAATKRLLALRPPAAVVAIAETGLFAEMPNALDIQGHPVLLGRSGIELVESTHRKRLVDGWLRALEVGLSRTSVRLVTGDAAAFHFVDLREIHGVFLGAVVPEEASQLSARVDTAAIVAPRLARARRDARGVFVEVDDALPLMLGRPPDEIVGHSSVELIAPEDHPTAIGNWMEMLANGQSAHRWRGRYVRGDRSALWVEVINTNRLADPEHCDVLSEFVDISEEMAAIEALRGREQLLRRLTDALPEAVIQVDAGRRILHSNRRMDELFGEPVWPAFDEQFRGILGAEWPRLDEAVRAMLAGSDGDLEVRAVIEDRPRVFEVVLRGLVDASGATTSGLVCISDITERIRLRSELERQATTDALTGLLNRASIIGVLETALESDRPVGQGIAAVFIDVDGFKEINDLHGHAAGDRLLALIAERLRLAVRSGDVVGRLGGDEFLVVCRGTKGPESMRRLGRRIQRQVQRPVPIDGVSYHPRVSIGVAWSAASLVDLDRLVACADAAMYTSKATGLGRPIIRGLVA